MAVQLDGAVRGSDHVGAAVGTGVAVAPGVVQQAQARAGTDLDECQWTINTRGELCQGWEQDGAASGFVGLGCALEQLGAYDVSVLVQPGQGGGGVCDGDVVPAHDPEEQVGLGLAGRQGGEESDGLVVVVDGQGEAFVGG